MNKLTAPNQAILLFIVFVFLYACKPESAPEDYSGFSEKHFEIAGLDKDFNWKDSIAEVKIQIPKRLDTFYQWHRRDDCPTCGRLQYRFADIHYSQFAESGQSWTTRPDSVFQLTFIHDPVVKKKNKELEKLKPVDTNSLSQYLANRSTWCDQFNFLYKKYEVIHGRTYILTAFTTNCSIITNDKPSLFVGAITPLKNMSLMILAESSASDTTGFIDSINKSFRSLEIDEPR